MSLWNHFPHSPSCFRLLPWVSNKVTSLTTPMSSKYTTMTLAKEISRHGSDAVRGTQMFPHLSRTRFWGWYLSRKPQNPCFLLALSRCLNSSRCHYLPFPLPRSFYRLHHASQMSSRTSPLPSFLAVPSHLWHLWPSFVVRLDRQCSMERSLFEIGNLEILIFHLSLSVSGLI